MQSCGRNAVCIDRAVWDSTLLHSPDCQRVRMHSILALDGSAHASRGASTTELSSMARMGVAA